MDPLSDVIALLRPHAVFSKPITGRGEWGVSYEAYEQPGFAVVLEGRCWLAVEGGPPVLLERGDFVLLHASPAFSLLSRPGAACLPGRPSLTAVRHGDQQGDPDFRMLGGTFRIEPVNAPLLLALLPGMIVIRSADDAGRLACVIDLVMDECASDRLGRAMILERLLEIMLMECLRAPGIGGNDLPAGLLAGMRDPALAAALRAMHADVRAAWTVAELGKIAGMSRSAFAARFARIVGCAPMEYLARWRMALARDALGRDGAPSLDRLAEQIGYDSASAFSTAFRRRTGSSPGAFARSKRQDRDAGSPMAA